MNPSHFPNRQWWQAWRENCSTHLQAQTQTHTCALTHSLTHTSQAQPGKNLSTKGTFQYHLYRVVCLSFMQFLVLFKNTHTEALRVTTTLVYTQTNLNLFLKPRFCVDIRPWTWLAPALPGVPQHSCNCLPAQSLIPTWDPTCTQIRVLPGSWNRLRMEPKVPLYTLLKTLSFHTPIYAFLHIIL